MPGNEAAVRFESGAAHQALSRHEPARWAIAITEPYVPEDLRIQHIVDMSVFMEKNTRWCSAFFAGILHDLAHTLPAEDPWLHLSALIDLEEVSTGYPSDDAELRLSKINQMSPLPALTGAMNVRGTAFGTIADAHDLAPAELPDPTQDASIAPTARNLSPLSGALIAFSGYDAKTMHFVVDALFHHMWVAQLNGLIDRRWSQVLLETFADSIRWLAYRRRMYFPDGSDPYMPFLLFAWMGKADRVNSGQGIESQIGLAFENHIDDGSYTELTE